MVENKKVITWSLIVIFLTLAISYSLTYLKKASLFKEGIQMGTGDLVQESNINEEEIISESTGSQNSINISEKSDSVFTNSIDLGDNDLSGVTNSHTQASNDSESSTSDRLASTNKKTLSGTSEYFGMLDIVDIIGVKPQITLQDSKGNYFVYYGESLDFVQTIKSLGGNVYEMVTESEILQNQLFGDKVSYINLSSFKDKRVLMVIEIDNDVWLLQVPANQYHYIKDYLKTLFIQ